MSVRPTITSVFHGSVFFFATALMLVGAFGPSVAAAATTTNTRFTVQSGSTNGNNGDTNSQIGDTNSGRTGDTNDQRGTGFGYGGGTHFPPFPPFPKFPKFPKFPPFPNLGNLFSHFPNIFAFGGFRF